MMARPHVKIKSASIARGACPAVVLATAHTYQALLMIGTKLTMRRLTGRTENGLCSVFNMATVFIKDTRPLTDHTNRLSSTTLWATRLNGPCRLRRLRVSVRGITATTAHLELDEGIIGYPLVRGQVLHIDLHIVSTRTREGVHLVVVKPYPALPA